METIQAIETEYDGYKFRSRLEARWAVFMKELGVKYEYEKEGYDLGELGWYLPDFWLPEHNCWLEIKGQMPTTEEQRKCEGLALGTMKVVYLSWSPIPSPEEIEENGLELIYSYSPAIFMGAERKWIERSHAVWCYCPSCGVVGLAYDGDGVDLARQGLCKCISKSDFYSTFDAPRILRAYEQARMARFEQGSFGYDN